MSFSQMAQDFVEATSTLVGGRTINIMDTSAVIIASTERARVGDYHQGAAEVIQTRQMVMIHEQDVKDYPGAKEGCNMPIVTDGRLVGVVGVFGKPEEVMEIANLLRVYVSQYFQQKFHMRRQRMETEVRTQLLDLLLTGKEEDRSQIMQLCNVLQVTLQFPLQVVLFQAGKETSPPSLSQVEELERTLLKAGLVRPGRDVYGMQNHSFVLIGREEDMTALFEPVLKNHPDYRMAVGGKCPDFPDIARSYDEAAVLIRLQTEPVSDIRTKENQLSYLFHCMSAYTGGWYVEELYQKLAESADQSNINAMLETARIYYEEGGSVAKAAERLHLHKNTLLYRMNRLFGILGMEEEKAFIREFFVRLILEMY